MVDIIAEKAAKAFQAEMDKRDYYFDLTGREGGRIRRFFHGPSYNPLHPRGAEDRDRFYRTIMHQLAEADQKRLEEWEARYESQLNDIHGATYDALIETKELRFTLAALLQSLLENAHQLDDGRRVFLSRSGEHAIDEFGEALTDEEFASVEWDRTKASSEDYLSASKDYNEALELERELEEYASQLEIAQGRIGEDAPLTQADQDELEQLLNSAPQAVSATLSQVEPRNGSSYSQSVTSNVGLTPN